MQLGDMIALRPAPAAGLLVTLTRRCPLRCAHCSTSSGPTGADTPADALHRFTGTFLPSDRPEVMMLTGGEPMLRPALVAALARRARRAGTRTAVLSGMFFARGGAALPPAVARAIRDLDHFSASLDAFHEREVERRDVFRALHAVRDLGVPVSVHLTGLGPADPYLRDATRAVRRAFRDEVPMLVTTVRPVGRAAGWAETGGAARHGADPGPEPCAMAAWPTVAFDGTVLACCNQRAVDRRPVPGHLRLGHIGQDTWPVIARRSRNHPVLRVLRTAGPDRATGGRPAGAAETPCARCHALADDPAALAAARGAGRRRAAAVLDRHTARMQRAAGPAALLRRYTGAPYAELVELGPAAGSGR